MKIEWFSLAMVTFVLVGCSPSIHDTSIEEVTPLGEIQSVSEFNQKYQLIGYVGCSITYQMVEGYWHAGGKKMWHVERRYDDGSVMNWGNPSMLFQKIFDENIKRYPQTDAIWLQLCIPAHEPVRYEHADEIVEMIRKRLPDVEIYVSSLAPYEHLCEGSGKNGVELGQRLAEELAAKRPGVKLGPIFSSLTIAQSENDRCHLNDLGIQTKGQELKEFFDTKNAKLQEDQEENDFVFPAKWASRVQTAFAPVECSDASERKYGTLRYDGPLIDTHFHFSSITSSDEEDDLILVLGVNHGVADITCMLEKEGTKKVFAFFPVYPESPKEVDVEIVKKIMNKYPDKFVPFIGPPQNDGSPDGFPTVDAQTFRSMLDLEPGLFKGYGEIGLYERGDHGGPLGSLALPPDSQRLLEIYPVVRKENLVVYFHLGEGQKESFERVLKQNPDIKFIWHGDQLIKYKDGRQDLSMLDEILRNNPNAYYGIDELYGDVWLLRHDVTKEEFLAHLDNYQPLLHEDLNTWKSFIEKHPDQVLWGTDRGGTIWSIDPEVGIALTNYARAFIARLDPTVQEKFAYKNAERLLNSRY